MKSIINILTNIFRQTRKDIGSDSNCANLHEIFLQAIADPISLQDCQILIKELDTEPREKHKVIYRWLTFIRKIFWNIKQSLKVCKPKHRNNILSWIATGTYYHYLSSDDEDNDYPLSMYFCAIA